jgi:hypothetical protein
LGDVGEGVGLNIEIGEAAVVEIPPLEGDDPLEDVGLFLVGTAVVGRRDSSILGMMSSSRSANVVVTRETGIRWKGLFVVVL